MVVLVLEEDSFAGPAAFAVVQPVDMAVVIVRVAVLAMSRGQFESPVRPMVVLHAHDNSAPRTVHTPVECEPTTGDGQFAVYRGLVLAPYIRNPRLF